MNEMLKKHWFKCIVVIELVILIAAFLSGRTTQVAEPIVLNLDTLIKGPDIWDMVAENGNLSVNRPGADYLEENAIYTCGPYIELPKGEYDITIQYETDTDGNTFEIYSSEAQNLDADYYTQLNGYLRADEQTKVTHIRANKNLKDFEVRTFYDGTGSLKLNGITIQQTPTAGFINLLYTLMIFFITMNILYIVRKRWMYLFQKEHYKYTASLIGLIFFSGILLYINQIYWGHDMIFHLVRIEGLKEALLSGQLPSRIHPAHMRGYGYATGVMYPELFLYIAAFARILGADLMVSYKIFVFAVNILTVISAFYAFQGIFKDRAIAFAGTVIYTLAPFRIMDEYYRAAVGEYSAMIGLPLIALGLYSFIKADREEGEQPHWLALALGYTAVIESHIISVVLVGGFSALVVLVYCRQFFVKQNHKSILKLCGTVLGLNAGFLIPFIDYFRMDFGKNTAEISRFGAMFGQLFTNQVIGDSVPGSNQQVADGLVGEIPICIGYALIISVACFLIFVVENKKKKWQKLGVSCFTLGVIAVLLSLHNFPWDHFIDNGFLGTIIINIQFPWRFLTIATIAFTVCGCIGIIYLGNHVGKKQAVALALVIAVFGYTALTDGYLEKRELISYSLSELPSFRTGDANEYMLESTDKNLFMQNGEAVVRSSEAISYDGFEKLGSNITLNLNSASDEEQFVDLPLVMYPGYIAKGTETGQKLYVTYGTNNMIRVMIPAGFSDTIKVSFAGKWYWHVAEFVSLLTVLYLVFGHKLSKLLKKQ